jgi:alpha-tubulin suppressor-like RCC1 family protein
MGNIATQTISTSGTWIAPAGVKQVVVTPKYKTNIGNYTGSNPANSSCWLNKAGAYFAFGQNNLGQLGTSDLVNRSTPTIISSVQLKKLFKSSVNPALFQSWGIDNLNRLVSWGQNSQGQIGANDITTGKSSPTVVLGSFTATQIATITDSTQILTTLGQLYAAGHNQDGECGTNQLPGVGGVNSVSSPTLVVGGLTFKSIFSTGDSANGRFSGITTSDVGYSWGQNFSGLLGTNENPATVAAKSSPTIIAGGYLWKDLTAGAGISTAGKLYTWGPGTFGSLGDGTTVARSSPAMIAAALTFSKFAEGYSRVLLDTDGNIYGWVAALITTTVSSPILISNGTAKFVSVKSASNVPFFLALTTDGKLYSWGTNASGQLGLGDTVTRSTPTLITTLTDIVDYKIGNGISYAVTKNGDVYSWGSNLAGELGTGDTTPRSTPTLVATIKLPVVETSDLPNFPSSTQINVTPGTSYTITFSTAYSTLGSTNVAFGELESLAISYSQ